MSFCRKTFFTLQCSSCRKVCYRARRFIVERSGRPNCRHCLPYTEARTTSDRRTDSHHAIKNSRPSPIQFTQKAKLHLANKINDPQTLKALLLTNYRAVKCRARFPNFFAQDAFNRWVQPHIAEMLWSEPCSSWFQQKVIVPWPGTILHYYAATEIVRWENYDLKFEQDDQKFASFGNGITEEGFTPKSIPWL
ncbi:Branched-chain-amino-acid aminotransferase, cytosolic [Fusarium oxysporum f. sp. albedinis]|nr:Branched-chain-amino-acid aminotransferase, cytosolic [Fusarium oxysporum f. sp. albedinis]